MQNQPEIAETAQAERQPSPTGMFGRVFAMFQSHPRAEWLIPVALCSLMLLQILLSVRQLSQTADEATHLYAGYRSWQCTDFGFGREHPPLAKLVAAAPLLRLNPPVNCAAMGRFSEAPVSVSWLYSQDWRKALSRARIAVSLFTVALCFLVWNVARKMFGLTAAMLATLLLVFEPNVLANGALVGTDMVLAFTFPLAVYVYYLWVKNPIAPILFATGLATGLVLISKHSGIIVLPVLCILGVADAWMQRGTQKPWLRIAGRNLLALVQVCLIAVAVIWIGYGLRYSARPDHRPLAVETEGEEPTPLHGVLSAIERVHALPEAYLEGLGEALGMAKGGASGFNSTYILGREYPGAKWFFFPVAMSIKYTSAFLILLAAAMFGAKSLVRERRREFLFMALPCGVYLAACLSAGMNNSIRHTLPLLPFLLVLVGAGWSVLIRRARWVGYAVSCLIVLHAASSLHAFPNYLTYANEFWGGPATTYKYLPYVDSGEAYNQVRVYLQKHPANPCWIATDYQVNPRFYGVPCEPFGFWFREPVPLRMRGTVIVSSTFLILDGEPGGPLAPFRSLVPKDRIGGSAMLVYEGDFDTTVAASDNERHLAADAIHAGNPYLALLHVNAALELVPADAETHRINCLALTAAGRPNEGLKECEVARALAMRGSLHADRVRTIETEMRLIRGIIDQIERRVPSPYSRPQSQ